jgi:hypothetical protein
MPLPPAPQTPQFSSNGRFHLSRRVLTIIAAVVVLAGASAAAYVGVVVPNKPQNVLRNALINTIQARQSTVKGSFEGSSSGVAYKVADTMSQNSDAKAADIKLDITVTGVTFPIEGRLADKNIYVKVGDLSTITSLLNAASPQAGDLAKSLSSKLSNQWIVIDSTLLKQAGADCSLNVSWGITKADTKVLSDAYSKHQFVVVKAAGSDVVNGKKVAKYNVTLDNDKSSAFGNDKSLDNLSLAKSLTKCDKSATHSAVTAYKGNHKTTALTVWVDKGSKRIAKVAYQVNSGNSKGTLTGTFDYGNVSIQAPTGAKPAVQVLSELETALGGSGGTGTDLTQLFGGGSASTPAATGNTLFQ